MVPIQAKGGKAASWLAHGGSGAESKKWVDSRETSEVVELPEVAGGLRVRVKTRAESGTRPFSWMYGRRAVAGCKARST